jgi:exopolysaccharide biosynthesis polyprenyl glycosylphosphotransferase
MLRRFSINFAIFSMVIDMLVVIGSMLLSTEIREWLNAFAFIKPIPAPISLPLQLYFLFPVITLLVFSALDIYDGKKHLRIVDEFGALTLSWMILSVSLAGILYFSYREVSRALYLTFIILVYLGVLTWRSVARLNFRLRNGQRENAARRILVIGIGHLGQMVREEMSRQAVEILRVVGYLDDNDAVDGDTQDRLGGLLDAKSVVKEHRITDVVIALPYSAYQQMTAVANQLEDIPVRVWLALGFFDLALYKLEISEVVGIPVLDLRASALNEYQLLTKRVFDLVFGVLASLVFSPLMILAGLAVWFEDRGPIIFKQQRIGENGRLFTLYKFRTMVQKAEQLRPEVEQVDESGNIIHKKKDDPRITRVGKILRRTSIDELPQLYNVIEGSMSLVGPRPELPYLVDQYQPWQRKRFCVPPGITGWWQVIGRGEGPMHLHTEDDLYYVQNYSIWLDIQILVRTLWVVIVGRGSH